MLKKIIQCSLFSFFLLLGSFFCTQMLAATQSQVKKEIAELNSQIASRRSQISSKSAALVEEQEALRRDVKSQEKRLERHERKIERADERLTFVLGNISELDSWYSNLGAIDQGLNSGTYETKKNALNVDKETAQSELRELNAEKQEYLSQIEKIESQIKELEAELVSAKQAFQRDKTLNSLLAKRRQKEKELSALEKQARIEAQKPKEPEFSAYVYAISGKDGNLDKELKLKGWVESYQAKYIQANWNDLNAGSSSSSGSMIQFLSQIDKEFDKLPANATIVLIGYGLGGGAAVLAATEVAAKKNRDIELLVTLDPMGQGESRMNAVFETEAYCQGRISPEQYVSCLSSAKKRVITPNVKNFYNRWQRESKIPFDAKDRMKVGSETHVLSTGKFLLASTKTNSNQKRMYYDDKGAHELILKDAAQDLPKLLVTHLR